VSPVNSDLVASIDAFLCSSGDIESIVRHWMTLPEPPSAIFALNDGLALQIMQTLQGFGLCIPDDVAVVGFDNQNITRFLSPTLTTVQQPFTALGETAAQLLLDRMAGRYKGPPRRVLLPTKLVIRQSCGSRQAVTAVVSTASTEPSRQEYAGRG
jgi:LacI family transcriptional regulator